jgi:hypothetical protein
MQMVGLRKHEIPHESALYGKHATIMIQSEVREYQARLTDSAGDKDYQGTVRIQYWNLRDRVIRSAKFAGMFLGLAALALLMPLLHFVLVPTFLLASPLIAFFVYGQASAVIGGEGKCPSCKNAFTIAKSLNRFPLDDLCSHCHQTVKIHLLEEV